MPNISEFVSRMSGGGARPNQFEVVVNFPQLAGSDYITSGNDLRFLCRAASLPASPVSDITVGFRGRPVHFAGERDFQPWGISVLCDTDFKVRTTFERWSSEIVEYNRTNGEQRPGVYQATLEVHQLDRNGNKLKSYTFYDAYPTMIGEIQLSFDQNSQIEEFPVQFVYNWFEPSKVPLTRVRQD